MWFPANYVEEISPSAAEPDRTVRIKPLKQDAYSSTFFCIYLKRNEYTCSHHSEVIHVFIYKDTYVLCFLSTGDDRKQSSWRYAERKS